MVVRQIAYGAAPDRGRTLLELAEVLDAVVLPQAIDEIGMSGDRTAVPPLMAMAGPGEAASRSPFVQLKAIESLGRLREPESVPRAARNCSKPRRCGWVHHRELRIAAAQALSKIDPRYSARYCPIAAWSRRNWRLLRWMRLRHVRGCGNGVTSAWCLRKTLSATIGSSWGKSSILIRELSLGGGMGTKEDNLRIGTEANIEISLGHALEHPRPSAAAPRTRQ